MVWSPSDATLEFFVYMEFDKSNWKEIDINTDSLWIIGPRAKGGKHENVYHGNFVPQIPNQMIRRYADEGGVVLDMFMGSGTTLFESENLGRNYIGFDIDDESSMLSKNSTTSIQFRALSDLKDIFSRNSHDLEGLLNWIYVNRKISFTQFARDEIVKQFVSAGYKIPTQASYYIPEINTSLTFQNFSKIDEIRKGINLNNPEYNQMFPQCLTEESEEMTLEEEKAI